jgi:hypothetical protein
MKKGRNIATNVRRTVLRTMKCKTSGACNEEESREKAKGQTFLKERCLFFL